MPEEPKLQVFLSRVWPDRLLASVPVKAIALLRVIGRGATRIRPTSPTEAFAHLVPSSLPLSPASALRPSLDRLGRFLRTVPAHWVELGTDLEQVPRALRHLVGDSRRTAERL